MKPSTGDWVGFMAGLANGRFTHAVTITFHQRHPIRRQFLNQTIAADTLTHILSRINSRCFKHAARRRGFTIAAASVLGANVLGEHLHAHLALQMPLHFSFQDFSLMVEHFIERCEWTNREFEIRPYRNEHWLSYMADHGFDSILLNCCSQAYP